MTFILFLFYFTFVSLFYIFNEVRIYRHGGDVFDYTIKLDRFLKRFGL